MSRAYSGTAVSVSRSQEQIRQMLIEVGARGVTFGEDFKTGQIVIRFGKEYPNGDIRTVIVRATPPAASKERFAHVRRLHGSAAHEQMVRATYRALHDWLKAQFVAVEFGLLSFENIFLSHFEWLIEAETGEVKTLGDVVQERWGKALPAPTQRQITEGKFREVKDE